MIDLIVSNAATISKFKLGNYIIQDLLERAPSELQDQIIKIIFDFSIDLSCDKYSSNVVEKAIHLASSRRRKKLVKKWLSRDDSLEIIKKLVEDQFGNYVVQTLLVSSGQKEQKKLLKAIVKNRHFVSIFWLLYKKSKQTQHDKNQSI
ncbi:RNA-binding protein of the pumilio family [Reticulomyxa filosa]|uniref:RNA-binding protein of the pumilio family n=1 Tax=Reticulomyxa filosa TaxID=46433 RepID=X6N2T6_RETFI|nr:RNA-binding protein of the pumilio family [Reticulomyxa filosa]|eukprot:ETO19632.1 RNA-binding protein of the pumilio family [Reticulomyxa filosa]